MGILSSDAKSNPYSDAEERMHKNMTNAQGGDADETFVRKMIEHHKGAIEMGQIHHQEGSDSELRAMVEKSRKEQEKEISELEDWLSRHARAT